MIRCNAIVLNRFSIRAIVFGHGKNDGGTIFHGDCLADGCIAVGMFADHLCTFVLLQSRRGNFRGLRGTAIRNHNKGQFGNLLLAIGIEIFSGIALALHVTNQALFKKQVRQFHAIFRGANGAVTKIKNQFSGVLLLQFRNSSRHFFYFAICQRLRLDIAHLAIKHSTDDRWITDNGACNGEFLRFWFTAENGKVDGSPGRTAQQQTSVSQRHVTRGNALNTFNHIAGCKT